MTKQISKSKSQALAVVSGAAPAKQGEEANVRLRLSPFAETPLFVRTTVQIEGAKRWFDRKRVTIVSQTADAIVLEMPASYAKRRAGIATLIQA